MRTLLPAALAAALVSCAGCSSKEATPPPSANPVADLGKTWDEALQQHDKEREAKLAERALKVGDRKVFETLEISPLAVEMRTVTINDFGDKKQSEPCIAITANIKNVSEGFVFNPFSMAKAIDSFGNECDTKIAGGLAAIDDDSLKDLQPGQSGKVIVAFKPRNPKATSWTVDISTASGPESITNWRMVIAAKDVRNLLDE